MRILIVEDETAASENLKKILEEINADIEIAGQTESISQTVKWLQSNPSPDLLFMDIHLSDGSAFNIFQMIDIEAPIIFTTAYDNYALDAFKVNSIDYILKPISDNDLKRALEKFKKLTQYDELQYIAQQAQLTLQGKYIQKILVPFRDKLLPITVSDISFVYTTDNNTAIYLHNGNIYPYAKALDSIMQTLNPKKFFRANKQYIISKESIKDITVWFDSRLLVTLDVDVPERLFVSKNRASEFKKWVVSE